MMRHAIKFMYRLRAVIFVAAFFCMMTIQPRLATAAEPITVLSGFDVLFMQVYVADKEKLFEKEGVNVKLKMSTTGKIAVDGLVAKAGVMAISGAFPAVSAGTTGPIQIVAPLSIADGTIKLITRPGIDSKEDLKGKVVGYQFGTDAHLFAIRYLAKVGMAETDVRVRNLPMEGLVSAFKRGDLDAVVTWEPISSKALKAVEGSNVLASDGILPIYTPVTMRKDFIQNNPDTAKKLLRALVAAHEFIKKNPGRAAEITAEVGQMEVGFVRELMSNIDYTMVIDDGMYDFVDSMSDFMVLNGDVKKKVDARNMINSSIMKAVAPSNVK